MSKTKVVLRDQSRRYKPQLDKAVAFLKNLQWKDQASDAPQRNVVPQSDARYGGWGYGRKTRPDLSNAHFTIEALHDAGLKADDPAFKKFL